jgi:CRP-like cAMP-binding protein
VLVTGADRHFAFCQSVLGHFHGRSETPNLDYADVDRALESAEDRLLQRLGVPPQETHQVPLEQQPLCRGLDSGELELLQSLLEEQTFGPGEPVCREGDPADRVYFLHRGRVSVSLRLDSKHNHRLGAFAAGWVFGESAFFPGHHRTADITADGPVSLYCLAPAVLTASSDWRVDGLRSRLLANLAEVNLDRLARANQEIRILTR